MPPSDPTSAVPARSLYLLYHELRPARTSYSYVVPTSDFEQHLELFDRIRESPGSELRPEITFDDGHRSNLDFALPLLEARGMHAHFFITVGWTGTKPGYMSWSDLRSLHAAGQTVGAHGWTHTLLTHCTRQELKHELLDARQALEDHLGVSVTTMSLPGGRFNQRVLDACNEAGYTHVFTSIPEAGPASLAATVGRLNIRGDVTLPWLGELFEPRSANLAALERSHRRKEAAKRLLGDRLYARLWSLLNREEQEPAPVATVQHEHPAHHQ